MSGSARYQQVESSSLGIKRPGERSYRIAGRDRFTSDLRGKQSNPMTSPADLAIKRLQNQQLSNSEPSTIPDLVRYMGALQAQDFAMAKWAVGVRIPGVTDLAVQDELDKGTILRTHVLRPTWHLVHADDIRWMLELTAPNVTKLMNHTSKALGLTSDIYKKSDRLIERVLSDNGHLTREVIMQYLSSNGLDISSIRGAHYMMHAELSGLVCSGPMLGKEQSYALLDERSPNFIVVSKNEALYRLAHRFFTSHGPATFADFSWWSGLSISDTRIALGELCNELESIELNGNNYYFNSKIDPSAIQKSVVHLLPAFDELVISYKDRSACVDLEHQSQTFTKNGIFKPIIMLNGRAIGVWSRTVRKDQVWIDCTYFSEPSDEVRSAVAEQAEQFAKFLSKKIVLR